jgi:NADP-dependent 3-hydroxy acid dehydrogenase YdfG
MIAGRREAKLREVAAAHAGEPVIAYRTTDITQRDQVQALVAAAIEQLGHIDMLVHAAGVNVKDRLFENLSPADWDLQIDINLTGAFNVFHEVVPHMRERSRGTIITISSISGKRASKLGGAAYTASKFGVEGLTHTIGVEELDNHIRTCVISPGEVDTEILRFRPNPVTDDHRAAMLQAEDVAAAVRFVAELPDHATVPEIIIKPAYQAWS